MSELEKKQYDLIKGANKNLATTTKELTVEDIDAQLKELVEYESLTSQSLGKQAEIVVVARDHFCNINLKQGNVVIKQGQKGKPDAIAANF